MSASCPPVLVGRLVKDEAVKLAAAFKAIADPVRLRVLNFIAAQPSGEACVCHFTGPLGLTQPTVSHHLKLLHDAGLVERERRGTWVHYRIVPERLKALREALVPPQEARKRTEEESKRKSAGRRA
jgi:ArsR family transcriptional regulator, arsenate/arsenite/antimonite-responsive transcriptional repressor